jgi:hypothetical protein
MLPLHTRKTEHRRQAAAAQENNRQAAAEEKKGEGCRTLLLSYLFPAFRKPSLYKPAMSKMMSTTFVDFILFLVFKSFCSHQHSAPRRPLRGTTQSSPSPCPDGGHR